MPPDLELSPKQKAKECELELEAESEGGQLEHLEVQVVVVVVVGQRLPLAPPPAVVENFPLIATQQPCIQAIVHKKENRISFDE